MITGMIDIIINIIVINVKIRERINIRNGHFINNRYDIILCLNKFGNIINNSIR